MAALFPMIKDSEINALTFRQLPSITVLFCPVFSDLDLSLSPTGKVVKTVGDTLPLKMEKISSGDVTVSWKKVMVLWLGY